MENRIPPLSREEIFALQHITFSEIQNTIANDLRVSLSAKGMIQPNRWGEMVPTPNGKIAASINSRRLLS